MLDDPPIVPSILVKTEIENQVPAVEEIYFSCTYSKPVRCVRVKLDYDQYKR
jgi:methyl coenzyme M reductase subunit C-like uncharacterized protein (methanogenesis marker protein 7)